MEKIRFAIAGCGRIGKRHVGHAKTAGEIVAVCDIVEERAQMVAQEAECSGYGSLEEMLAKHQDIDVVAVCTPNGLHAEHTIQALSAGHHVLCEKPMAIRVRDCIEMIRAAEANNRRLFIVKQNRYNPPIVALKQLIDEGKLGKILSVHLSCFWNRNPAYFDSDWKGTKDLDGGTLFTQFSHFIDLVYWLCGDVEDVRSFADNAIHQDTIEFEDQAVAVLRFQNGALGTMHFTVNSYKQNMEGSITIFGEKGTVKVGGQYLNELEYQMVEDTTIDDLPEGNPPNLYEGYVGSMSNHGQVYQNVVEVLQDGGSIMTVGIEGLKTVEIIEAIYKVAKSG